MNEKVNSCFVRINTKELREKLEALGFRNTESINSSPERSYGLLAREINSNKKFITGLPFVSEETTGLFFADEYIKERSEIIDCGRDEQLFLQYCRREKRESDN